MILKRSEKAIRTKETFTLSERSQRKLGKQRPNPAKNEKNQNGNDRLQVRYFFSHKGILRNQKTMRTL